MALGWAVRESGKEDPRTKGQHAGAGLRDDCSPTPYTHTHSLSAGILQDGRGVGMRPGRRHKLGSGGTPSPIPLRDVPASLSPVLFPPVVKVLMFALPSALLLVLLNSHLQLLPPKTLLVSSSGPAASCRSQGPAATTIS